MRTILRQGSAGQDVQTLQTRLNLLLTPSPLLAIDGHFGHGTHNAVLRFQTTNWLVNDGLAGPATWNALMGLETYPPILNSVTYISQPTPQTCWAASTAMLTRTNVQAVIARTPNTLINPNGSLRNDSELRNPLGVATQFARANSLKVLPPQSWLPLGLRHLLLTGPFVMNALWRVRTYLQGRGSDSHLVVVAGIRGDNDPSGEGTTLRIFDPLNGIYSVGYHDLIRRLPASTYQIYQRA